jgi:hypothetical protein
MNQERFFQGQPAGSRSTTGRKLRSARNGILAVLMVLLLGGLATPAFGQGECLSQCERGLSECLHGSMQDPAIEMICVTIYEACCDGCIGF